MIINLFLYLLLSIIASFVALLLTRGLLYYLFANNNLIGRSNSLLGKILVIIILAEVLTFSYKSTSNLNTVISNYDYTFYVCDTEVTISYVLSNLDSLNLDSISDKNKSVTFGLK